MPYKVKLKVVPDANKQNREKKEIGVFPVTNISFPVESEAGIAQMKNLFSLGKSFNKYEVVEIYMEALKIFIDDIGPLKYDGARYNAVSERVLRDVHEAIKFFNDVNNFNNHYSVFASGSEYS